MKNQLIFIASMFVVLACRDANTKFLGKIDGRWQVNTATYSGGAGRDSTATLSTTFLTFDPCSASSNGGSPSNCKLQYTSNNQQFSFAYQATNEGKSIYISPTSQMSDASYREVADRIAGGYEVLTSSDNALVIRRSLAGSGSKYQYVQFSASK